MNRAGRILTSLRALLACCALAFLSACSLLQSAGEVLPVAYYSPAAYYRWAESASAERRQQELERISRYESPLPLVPAAQGLILDSTANLQAGALPQRFVKELTPHLESAPSSRASVYEQDYYTFTRLLLDRQASDQQYSQMSKLLDNRTEKLSAAQKEIGDLKATIKALTEIEQNLAERELDRERNRE